MSNLVESVHKAKEVISMFNLEYPLDIELLCKNLDIEIVDKHNLNVEGYLYKDLDCKIIFISRRVKNRHKRNFIVAHELGHYFLHTKELFQACTGITEVFDKHSLIAESEIEANTFASELLMPTEMVIEELSNTIINFDLVSELASKFDVSITSMAIKCIQNSKSESEMLFSYKKSIKMWYTYANKEQNNLDMRYIQDGCPYGSLIWDCFNNLDNGIRQKKSNGIWKMFNDYVNEEVYKITEDTYLVIVSGIYKDFYTDEY